MVFFGDLIFVILSLAIYIYIYVCKYIWKFQVDGKPHRQIAILFLIWQVACCLGYGWCEIWVFYRVILWPNPSIASPKTLKNHGWKMGSAYVQGLLLLVFGRVAPWQDWHVRGEKIIYTTEILHQLGSWALKPANHAIFYGYVLFTCLNHTVGGRNPAPVDRQSIPSFTYRVFLHPRWLFWNFFHQ